MTWIEFNEFKFPLFFFTIIYQFYWKVDGETNWDFPLFGCCLWLLSCHEVVVFSTSDREQMAYCPKSFFSRSFQIKFVDLWYTGRGHWFLAVVALLETQGPWKTHSLANFRDFGLHWAWRDSWLVQESSHRKCCHRNHRCGISVTWGLG